MMEPNLSELEGSSVLYRKSTLGVALTDALDELITAGKITAQLARNMLTRFDEAVPMHLSGPYLPRMNMTGSIGSYNSVEGLLAFKLKNAKLEMTTNYGLTETVTSPDKTIVKVLMEPTKFANTGRGKRMKALREK